MADNWYYVQGGTRQGPVTHEVLQGKLAAGELLPTDSVWKEGMSGWAMAGQVPGLMPAPATVPPPVSSPASMPVSTPPVNMGASVPGVNAPNLPAVKSALPAINTGIRIMVIIAAAACLVATCVPYFYVTSTAHTGTAEVAAAGAVADDTTISRYSVPFGFGFWWGILIFVFAFLPLIAAILDLSLRVAIIRTINKWVILGCFGVIAILALVHVPLAIFGIGLGDVALYEKGDPDWITYNEMVEGVKPTRDRNITVTGIDTIKKRMRDAAKNGTKEQKEAADKAIADTYVTLHGYPIGAAVALLAGLTGLFAASQIVMKKK